MFYDAISCVPTVNFSTGKIKLKVRAETMLLPLDLGLILFNTLNTHLALIALALLPELYLVADFSYRMGKSWFIGKKITHLKQYAAVEIETIKNKRLEKLAQRKIKQTAEKVKILAKVKQDYYVRAQISDLKLEENITKTYKAAKNQKQKEYKDNKQAKSYLRTWEKIYKTIKECKLIDQEIQIYQNKTSEETRKILINRFKFKQLHQQIAKRIDQHYLYTLVVAQIPIIGLLFVFHSKYTTKDALEKTAWIEKYNKKIAKYAWLRP